jgi:TonB family protein
MKACSKRRLASFFGALVCLPIPVAAQTKAAPRAVAPTAGAKVPAIVSPASLPTYPDTVSGLESLMKDMIKARATGNPLAFEPYAKSLDLPQPEVWYQSVFGNELGAELAAFTERARSRIGATASDTLGEFIEKKRTDVEAFRFNGSCDWRASPVEYPVLLLRQRQEPLFDVRFSGDGSISTWFYFAYVDGAFRYVGAFRRKEMTPAASEVPGIQLGGVRRIHAEEDVERAARVYSVEPDYAMELQAAGLQGNVILHAVIGTDGAVQDLDVVEGACPLARPALDAVKKWRYKPMMMDGAAVQVDTYVTVPFVLPNPQK